MTFKREERYVVLKHKDLFNNKVPEPLLTQLENILEKVSTYMPIRNYVIVESDWPEYEVVWKMIEDRCKNDL